MVKTFQYLLPELFESTPRLVLTRGDLKTFRLFRAKEPHLQSILDEKENAGAREEFFLLLCEKEPAGCLSLVTQTNRHRKGPRKTYARIDLVIVPPQWRNVGMGEALLRAALYYMITHYDKTLYSISCLAAHPAVEKVLRKASFSGVRQNDENFTRQKLEIENHNVDALRENFRAAAQDAIGLLNFRLRQKKNT